MKPNETPQDLLNKRIRQFFVISAIVLLGILLFNQLLFMLSAFFGAITLYIILRKPHKRLVRKYKWRKGLTSLFLMACTIVLLLVPIYFIVQFVAMRISPYLQSTEPLLNAIHTINNYISSRFDFVLLSGSNLIKIKDLASKVLPSVIGSGLMILTDLILMYFLLWFMLNKSFEMERWIKINSPFNRANTRLLLIETKDTILNNAIGIIILGFIQGLFAMLGYYIFGVNDPILWGLITGAASVIPFAGTMIVWVPLTILLFANGDTMGGIGLAFYGFIVIGGIDNVMRFILQKKIAQTHPLITVFGVIVGLNLFGFWGLIFGPLMFSLFILLGRVYKKEYLTPSKSE